MPHKEAFAMPAGEQSVQPAGLKVKIIRSETMFGNIRIRCPIDLTEHEVPVGTKEFVCPVGGEKLTIENLK